MPNYDFDKIIPRAGTDCVKYDLRKAFFGREEIIPMWVADMDFAVPEFVSGAIEERAKHPIYGYSILPEGYYSSITSWWKKRHGYAIEKDWIIYSPGIVTALNLIVETFTSPGDGVIVQPPVYFPFFWAVERNNCKLLHNELKNVGGHYEFDFEDLKKQIRRGAKMIILCSPHNPVGRVWTEKELSELVSLCLENGVKIVSDEIHADLALSPHKHIPTAILSAEAAANTITCLAPSKTFNLAGLNTSSVVISNEEWREKFKKTVDRVHLGSNIFGAVASVAAYTHGEDWLNSLLEYLHGNASLVYRFLEEHNLPITASPLEATYLMWLDFDGVGGRQTVVSGNKLKSQHARLKTFLVEELGLGLHDGRMFGPGGRGFQRMNIGCPRSVLHEALQKFKQLV